MNKKQESKMENFLIGFVDKVYTCDGFDKYVWDEFKEDLQDFIKVYNSLERNVLKELMDEWNLCHKLNRRYIFEDYLYIKKLKRAIEFFGGKIE